MESDKSKQESYFSYLVTIKNRNEFAKYMLKNEVYTVLKRNHLDVIAKNKHRQEPKKAYVRQFKSKNSQLY